MSAEITACETIAEVVGRIVSLTALEVSILVFDMARVLIDMKPVDSIYGA